ncbi:MAG: hypothetical protein ACTSRY_04065 [Alphaproteobacteria bacterium]
MRPQPSFDARQRPDRVPLWVGVLVAAAAAVMVVTYSQVRFAENIFPPPHGGAAPWAEAGIDPSRQLGAEALRRLSETAPAAGPPVEIGASGDGHVPSRPR